MVVISLDLGEGKEGLFMFFKKIYIYIYIRDIDNYPPINQI